MDTIHTVHKAHAHFGWNNAFEPVLDFAKINPVTGPIYVRGARPGDVLVVEILELALQDWSWTGIIPGFGLLADDFTEPYLHIWELPPGATGATFLDRFRVPLVPFPRTIGVAPAEPGDHSVVPPAAAEATWTSAT